MAAGKSTFFARWFRALRLSEVGVMLGFACIGMLYSAPVDALRFTLAIGSWFLIGMGLLFIAIYAFNAWAGGVTDRQNARLQHLSAVSPAGYLAVSVSLVVLALAVLQELGWGIAALAAADFALWCVYSLPRIGLKHRPFAGTLAHIVAQCLHFSMGYLLFQEMNLEWAVQAGYFSLLFGAGHLQHETIDRAADEAAGSRTTAVVYGEAATRLYSHALFTGAALLQWLWLAGGHGAQSATWAFGAASLIHIAYIVMRKSRGSRGSDALAERSTYRHIYFWAGIVFIALRWR